MPSIDNSPGGNGVQAAVKTKAPILPEYFIPKPTTEELPWADLIQLDLAKFDEGPEARRQLAEVMLESCHSTGFLYLVNHGVDEKTYQYHAKIAKALLDLPYEEQEPYFATKERAQEGRFTGFKPQQLGAANGLHQTINHWNWPRFHSEIGDEMEDHIPDMLRPFMEDAKALCLQLHKVVARKLFLLLAMALKVPLDTYTNIHTYESKCESFLRYMKYESRTEHDNTRFKDLYLPGHADWGSFTFLFNQPITSLQILDPENQWKYVKYVEGTIVVNVGEALSHLTGGYLKPTIHRVVRPPADQEKYSRVSIIYFTRPFDTCSLVPPESPVLKERGYQKVTENLTMAQYASARYGGYKRLNYDFDKVGADPQGPHTMKKI